MSEINDFNELAKSLSPNEIVVGLSKLSTKKRKIIIDELKQTLEQIRFQYGQVCKVLLRDAGEKIGVILGGGQKAKMWIMGTPSSTFYKVSWEAILEQFPDKLYVEKQGKYRWPVDRPQNEKYYKLNQEVIAKFLNGTTD